MSKGVGKLQREIIAHLADPIPATGWSPEGEVEAYGICFVPAAGVYDLRHVSKTMARSRGLMFMDWDRPFQAAFSRAVRTLVRRGILEKVDMVPVQRVCRPWRQRRDRGAFQRLADGNYLAWCSPQTRFVRLTASGENLDPEEPARQAEPTR